MSQRHNLAQRLEQPQALLAPGVYDALTALVAQQAGFEALYLSGASIAYTRLGRSDIGLTTATEVAQTLAHITDRVNVPVIVDADTGFGNALNTQRTVRDFERAGFEFEGASDALAHPADDHTINVFNPAIRGKTDQFVFRFRKPLK
jgi:2-methylisocitrate lyase-like PEP mutase family enzyme